MQISIHTNLFRVYTYKQGYCTYEVDDDDDDVDAGGGLSEGCRSNLPTMPMPGTSSTLKIRYKDPNLGKVAR